MFQPGNTVRVTHLANEKDIDPESRVQSAPGKYGRVLLDACEVKRVIPKDERQRFWVHVFGLGKSFWFFEEELELVMEKRVDCTSCSGWPGNWNDTLAGPCRGCGGYKWWRPVKQDLTE